MISYTMIYEKFRKCKFSAAYFVNLPSEMAFENKSGRVFWDIYLSDRRVCSKRQAKNNKVA